MHFERGDQDAPEVHQSHRPSLSYLEMMNVSSSLEESHQIGRCGLHHHLPILLVLGGLVLGFISHLPPIVLSPDLVFLIFLPPLLCWEALNAPIRDLRTNMRPILLLTIGLVLATTSVVGVVAHLIIDLPWPVAFVLGAIISPTDTVAASVIAQRLSLPMRIIKHLYKSLFRGVAGKS